MLAEYYGSDVFDYAAKVTMTARETAEAFIFETVYPFCVKTTETTVKKSELAEALLRQKPRKPIADEFRDICPVCGATLLRGKYTGRDFENHYCAKCGQKIDFMGVAE